MVELGEGTIVANRYRLVRLLGTGGMGSVWLAHDQTLDAACALKLIDADKRENDEVRVRFEREARAAAQLRGPHVVDVFDHGIWEKTPFIAMEYLQGEDLATRLEKERRLTPEATYRFIAQVARALTRAHAFGIVHRDLKPENIFLVQSDEGEQAKVLDFGIARHQSYSLKDQTTKTGSFLGTPFYMSPEQAKGKTVDHRSDLWAIGVIAFQCLTGRPPFDSEALGELIGQIVYDDLPVPSQVFSEVPPGFDAFWARAVARSPEDRFQSAKELSDALALALGITQLLQVPSVAPRAPAPSIPDGRASAPPPQQGAVRSSQLAREGNHSTTANGSALSRTRWSVIPQEFVRKAKRHKHVAGIAVVSLLVGVLATIGLTSSATQPESAAASPAPAGVEPQTPVRKPPPQLPTGEAVRSLSVESLPIETAAPDGSAGKPTDVEQQETSGGSEAGPAVNKPVVPGPSQRDPHGRTKIETYDYGI